MSDEPGGWTWKRVGEKARVLMPRSLMDEFLESALYVPGSVRPIDWRDVGKAARKYPAGTPGGKGGQWMPGEEALAALPKAHPDADDDEAALPFEHGQSQRYAGDVIYRDFAAKQTHRKLETIDPHDVSSVDPNISRAITRRTLRAKGPQKPVEATRVDGDLIITDGTHRAAAAYLRGEKLQAYVTDVDAYERDVKKAKRKYPAGTAGGKGGQWMPGDPSSASASASIVRNDLGALEKNLFGKGGATQYAQDLAATVPGAERTYMQAVESRDGQTLEMRIRVFGGKTKFDKPLVDLKREFKRITKTEVVVLHDQFKVDPALQSHGIGKRMTAAAFEHYDKMGVTRIDTLANIDVGGYAWARTGFQPQPRIWENGVAAGIAKRAVMLHQSGDISKQTLDAVRKITDSPDQRGIWQIADMRVGTHNLGKDLLLGSTWQGEFRFKDPVARKRAQNYIHNVSKANPNHYPAGSGRGGQFAPGSGGGFAAAKPGAKKTPAQLKAERKARGKAIAATSIAAAAAARGDAPPVAPAQEDRTASFRAAAKMRWRKYTTENAGAPALDVLDALPAEHQELLASNGFSGVMSAPFGHPYHSYGEYGSYQFNYRYIVLQTWAAGDDGRRDTQLHEIGHAIDHALGNMMPGVQVPWELGNMASFRNTTLRETLRTTLNEAGRGIGATPEARSRKRYQKLLEAGYGNTHDPKAQIEMFADLYAALNGAKKIRRHWPAEEFLNMFPTAAAHVQKEINEVTHQWRR